MASSLELAKLIIAGYLYNYWEKINKVFRIYLSIGTLILVLITSLGIYGFLTSAFQDTFNVYSVTSKQKAFLEQKEEFWQADVTRYDEELKRISDNISTLSNAKASSLQVRDTTVAGGVRNTISTTELRLSQQRIAVEEENRKDVQSKREVAADSLQSIQLQILELDTNTEVGSELGPLQYLSGLLNKPMDQIINWFILIIIFVFDPLAVAMVVAFNNALKVDRGEDDKKKVVQKRELYGEEPDEEESTLWDNTLNDGLEDEEWDDWKDVFPSEDIDVESEEVLDESNLDLDGDGIVSDEERAADTDGDGKISEEEYNDWYENKGGWKAPYNGKDYWFHPKFDWSKRERWINNQSAIKYWVNNRGGSYTKVEQYRKDYPTDFTSKTY